MGKRGHPSDPRSNIAKIGTYDSRKYTVSNVSQTFVTDESLTPGRPPTLTQRAVAKFLQPLTKELTEVPPSPSIVEVPDAVIDHMVMKDKAFWVDKPGANAYTLHDAYYNYGMTTEMIKPPHQDVFPRSYQYDLDCVKYRRHRACDSLIRSETESKHPTAPHCRNCSKLHMPGLTQFQLSLAPDSEQKRWKYYPDVTVNMSAQEIRKLMDEVGRPFRSEACNWYNQNYPSVKHDIILRKFSK